MDWTNAIAGPAGVISQVIAGRQQRRNIQDQLSANKELAEYQYSRDLEQWHRANEYNSPTMQMARLREAGLNPNMVYGTGGAKTLSAQSPKYQNVKTDFSARQPMLQPLQILSAYQDFKMKNAQIDLLQEQKRTQQAMADLRRSEANWSPDYYKGRAWINQFRGDREKMERAVMGGYGQYVDTFGNERQTDKSLFGMQQSAQLSRIRNQIDYIDWSTQLKQKEVEYYFMNRLLGPLSQSLKLIPGIGRMFGRSGRSISRKRTIGKQTLPDWKYQSWK